MAAAAAAAMVPQCGPLAQERCAWIYQQVVWQPMLSGGFLVPQADPAAAPTVVLSVGQKDLEQDQTRTFVRTCVPGDARGRARDPLWYESPEAFPAQVQGLVASRVSPSGRLRVQIRKQEPKKKDSASSTPCYSIEVLSRDGLLCSLSTEGVHGELYVSGSILSGLDWSPDETCIVYVAEEAPPKTCGLWDKRPE
jgi:hypothetical protein